MSEITVYREKTDKQGDEYLESKEIKRDNLKDARKEGYDVKGNVNHVHNVLMCTRCEEKPTDGKNAVRCNTCWEKAMREKDMGHLID